MTAGCTIRFSSLMRDSRPSAGLEPAPKAASASFARFTLPSGSRISRPKWRTTSLYTNWPGCMSWCAIRSAWIRCAPSATNISPTTDLPEAMPPVRPTFSIGPPDMQSRGKIVHHRDTEARRKAKQGKERVSLSLCVSLFVSLWWILITRLEVSHFRYAVAPAHPCCLHRVEHQHRDGEWADAARHRGDRSCSFSHFRMNVAHQRGTFCPESLFAFGIAGEQAREFPRIGHFVHADVDHSRARLYEIAGNHAGTSDGGHQNVRPSAHGRQIPRLRMADRDRGV